MRRLAGDDRLDHGARGSPVQVADNDAESNTAVAEHFVQPVFFRMPVGLLVFVVGARSGAAHADALVG